MQIRFKSLVSLLALTTAIFSMQIMAEEIDSSKEVPGVVASNILAKLHVSRPDLSYGKVEYSPMPNVYQVQVSPGPLLYVSEDGEFFITGTLYGIEPGGFTDVQSQLLLPKRKEAMAAIDKDDMVTFSPEGEVKASIYVFTDIDCGYCRKLHREVPAMNAKGIEVNYLAFPRAGAASASAQKMVGVMCADDKQEALTKIKANTRLSLPVCENSSVAEQYELGNALGVRGTPAIVLADGSLLPGYVTADQMARKLGL